MSRRTAVAATSALAAQAGLDLAQSGGSAVDAAIAAMVVSMVTEPGVVTPMGGAFVNIWSPARDPVVIDGNVEMPGRDAAPEAFGAGLREVSMEYGGGITVFGGAGSVATPGGFAAFERAHRQHGRAPWAEVMAPAIRAAADGFSLGSAAASYLWLTHAELFSWDEQTRLALHRRDGTPVRAGDRIRSADLARSLESIATHGTASLYTGELAEVFAADQQARGGLVGRSDLAGYRAVERPAVRTALHEWTLAANPPPSIGGPVLTAMLRLLSRHAGAAGSDAAGVRAVLEVQRAVLAYRFEHIDTSADLEPAGRALLDAVAAGDLVGMSTSASTAHVSVVDQDGLACAITASAGYGSGATLPGTGLMLNNCLGEPELNRLGLHALPPGTRLASNMAPTTARHTDGRVLVVGTPGADRITTALQQVLWRHLLLGQGLQDAIDAPRVHLGRLDDLSYRVEAEPDPAGLRAAADLGLPVREHEVQAMYFGGVGAAARAVDGTLSAAADPRRAAATAVG